MSSLSIGLVPLGSTPCLCMQEVKLQKTSSLDAAKKESSELQKQVSTLQSELDKAQTNIDVSHHI